jgi:hypothetical protein
MSCTCECCTGIRIATPAGEINPPGLSAIAYRAGVQGTFLETMLARLSGLKLEAPSAAGAGVDVLAPLAGLTTRDPADPSIALLDGWACVADVLTFYQERIANEGYLQTATQLRSLLELANLIGYRARPGVSAAVKLAFTVTAGFQGVLPAGTRAQSIPKAGQNPQFFETSADLDTRDVWNTLAPRLTRPTLITPPATDSTGEPEITGADVIDTVYFDGLSTNLKAGDALLFAFGPADPQLRVAAVVTPQPTDQRTSVTLAPQSIELDLQLVINQAALFPGSDIAAAVTTVLTTVMNNVGALDIAADIANVARGALPAVQRQRDLAEARGFDRLSAWIDQALRLLTQGARLGQWPYGPAGRGRGGGGRLALKALPLPPPAAPLAVLHDAVSAMALPPSIQPANATRLIRSVAKSFSAQSDMAPRLLQAFNPLAKTLVYPGWRAGPGPSGEVEIYAARVKAGLFAGTWAGAVSTASTPPVSPSTATTIAPSYTPPTIASAWSPGVTISDPPPFIALDAVYDQIVQGSWVAVQFPDVDSSGDPTGEVVTTYHVVTDLPTVTMDTGGGFAAKVTQLVVSPAFLQDYQQAGAALKSTAVLRQTRVFAQTESLALTEEPLDADWQGDTLDLDQVYDGLEPGRWVIVSGNRTDIPGVSGVQASELAMVAAVAQGAQPPLCAVFPLADPPFASVAYTSEANAAGDRLVVGVLSNPDIGKGAGGAATALSSLPAPLVFNQQYCQQVDLGGGVYANPYVPTADERAGQFPDFVGLLVDPTSQIPFRDGIIPQDQLVAGLFAWRVSTEALHTILSLASPLAYSYDRASVTLYGNVADATHGQTVGEILGNGDASQVYQSFTLRQSPLTYVSAPTPSGVASTLSVQVNALIWQEVDDLAQAGPADRVFVTSQDDSENTSIEFGGGGGHGAAPPTGVANIKATYRYGLGAAGNVDAGQISQLSMQPLGAQSVINPLPATGGADPDTTDQVRANAPIAGMALDRLVSVSDYGDFSRNYAGIGKAAAAPLSDGRRRLVYVTIAGADDIPIDPSSDLYRNLVVSLQTYGDPSLPIAVGVRTVRLLVIAATIGLVADYVWEEVQPQVTAAIQALFAFDNRALGQPAFASEAILAAQSIAGVAFVNLTTFDGVPETITAAGLAGLGQTLRLRQTVEARAARIDRHAAPGSAGRILPAELVFMTPDIPATLTLTQAAS